MTTLACLWIAWCTLHSLLISRQAHHFFDRILSRSSGIYRIVYVVFSVVSLVPVLWYQFSLPQQIIMQPGVPVRIIQGILLIYAAIMFYLGGQVYDMHYVLGITQWRNARKKKPAVALPFHMDGVLTYVRHPWYSGGIALLWGFGTITDVYLLTRIILTGYLIIGTWLEEKRLKMELGEQYAEYCRKVPMLIPWKFIR